MTNRADLLALTTDDLMVLSNRGLVKRATKEISAGTLSYELQETEEGLQFIWSDGVTCKLPADEALSDRHCSCNATKLCRHLIRSVLAYQAENLISSGSKNAASEEIIDVTEPETAAQKNSGADQSWNPGDIQDDVLSRHFSAAQLKKLRQEFTSGQIIEVNCSRKPTAQLHTFPHTLRFLVPNDLRYTYCDCIYDSPCPHVPLAIWAFRELPPQATSGIISTEAADISASQELLRDIAKAVHDLVITGLAGLSPSFVHSLKRLEERCQREYLVWPADILADLFVCCNFYFNQDARFSPNCLSDLICELCVRCDAIQAHTGAIPQLFVRGPHVKKSSELGSTRLIGLGGGIRVRHKSFSLGSYFQDTDSGQVLAYVGTPHLLDSSLNAEENSSFLTVAQKHVFRQTTWAKLGAGQLLIKKGSCSPKHQLHLKRNQSLVVNPQRFEWEKLRAPVLVDDFRSLTQRLQVSPPKMLRPRKLTENFYVFAISYVESVRFSAIEQSVCATIFDGHGNRAFLSFPYMNQSHNGVEALLRVLAKYKTCFISAHASIRAAQIHIVPTAVVFERDKRREILQPWIHNFSFEEDATEESTELNTEASPSTDQVNENSPIPKYLQQLSDFLSEMFINGLHSSRLRTSLRLENLIAGGNQLGFSAITSHLTNLKANICSESSSTDHTAQEFLKLLVLSETLQQSLIELI